MRNIHSSRDSYFTTDSNKKRFELTEECVTTDKQGQDVEAKIIVKI